MEGDHESHSLWSAAWVDFRDGRPRADSADDRDMAGSNRAVGRDTRQGGNMCRIVEEIWRPDANCAFSIALCRGKSKRRCRGRRPDHRAILRPDTREPAEPSKQVEQGS